MMALAASIGRPSRQRTTLYGQVASPEPIDAQ
jgi:FO synthase